MNEIMTGNWGRWADDDQRGVSPVMGLIILIAMVVAGIAVVLLTGSTMVDSLEAGAEQEKVEMCLDETDHRLATVASTGQEQPMEFEDQQCQPQTAETGSITVAWYDDGDDLETFDWTDEDETESVDLGALEFDLSDQTVAHQGGGIWELTDSGARVERAPPIGFDDEDDLQLEFMRIDSNVSDGSLSKATSDYQNATNTAEALADYAQDIDGENFAIRIDSEYADGWERHFKEQAEETSRLEKDDVRRDDGDVIVAIEDLGDVTTAPQFTIDDHRGLIDGDDGTAIDSNLVEQGDNFWVGSTLKNQGDDPGTVEATISIYEEGSDSVIKEETIESRDDVSDTIDTSGHEPHGDWKGGNPLFNTGGWLDKGEAYEYNLSIEPGGDHLEERETFYYLDNNPNYAVTDTSYSSSGDEITLEATIRNIGVQAGTEETVTLEIPDESGDDDITSTTDIQLDGTEEATVSWTLDETAWPRGEYDFTVGLEDDSRDGTFEVTSGTGFQIDEDLGIPDDRLVNDTDGQVVIDDDAVTVNATLDNTLSSEHTETVTLEVLDTDGTVVDTVEQDVTIDGDETEQVALTADADLEDGELYEYNISTETDELDDLGSFFVEGSSPFTIRNVVAVDDPVSPGDSLTVTASIENQDETDTQYVWLEGFDGTIATVEEVEIGADETTDVPLEWSAAGVPESGDANVTVGTGTDTATAAVDVEPRLEVTDVEVLEDSVDQDGTATVEADLEAIGGDARQDVVLEGFDGDRVASEGVSVSDGETETVRLTYESVGDRTDRVTVTTENDDADGVVVVERSGPDCSAVDYAGSGTESDPYTVSSVDQLQCIDEDLDAHYELVDDIDAHGTEYWNGGHGFEPIGDYGDEEFSGDFDGNGHAIEGLHIDRSEENFVGLFGANSHFEGGGPGIGDGSTIRNLRLENVSVHGQQVTGGLIGAAGGTIENVRVSGTVEAEYQEVGGIVGSAHNADLDNRLVSEATVRGGLPAQSARASHPWGANNLGIGGIVGATGYNTQVSTAYSQADVEGPFGVGGIVGWTSDYASENEQMYWAEGDITITIDEYPHDTEVYLDRLDRSSYGDNTGGAIFGRGDDEGDGFDDSVYYNSDHHAHPFGEHVVGDRLDVNDRNTDQMKGLGVDDRGNLSHLEYEDEGGPWVALPDDYPRFAWELAAEGRFDVAIDDVENVTAGEEAEVTVTVTSRYANRAESNVTQTISLSDPEGRTVDTQSVALPSSLEEDETETITLVWQTGSDDTGSGEVAVHSEETSDSAPVEVDPAEHGPGASVGPGLGPGPADSAIGDKGDYDLERGASDGTKSGGPTADPNIDISVDVVEFT